MAFVVVLSNHMPGEPENWITEKEVNLIMKQAMNSIEMVVPCMLLECFSGELLLEEVEKY
jgi:hypothetical protein